MLPPALNHQQTRLLEARIVVQASKQALTGEQFRQLLKDGRLPGWPQNPKTLLKLAARFQVTLPDVFNPFDVYYINITKRRRNSNQPTKLHLVAVQRQRNQQAATSVCGMPLDLHVDREIAQNQPVTANVNWCSRCKAFAQKLNQNT